MAELINFQTEDGVTIVADWYPVEEARAHALLLHMMPATKEAWPAFAAELNARGIAALAIDERGHGESTMGGELLFKNFTDEEQQDKILDVRAALTWLVSKGATAASTIVIGGSIGANLTIQTLTEQKDILTGVALSPGLNYRGILTGELITKLNPGQKVLLVASDDDTHRSFETIDELNRLNPEQTEKIELSGLGHANDMLDNDPGLIKTVADWIESRL